MTFQIPSWLLWGTGIVAVCYLAIGFIICGLFVWANDGGLNDIDLLAVLIWPKLFIH